MKHVKIHFKGRGVESKNLYKTNPILDQDKEFSMDRWKVMVERILEKKSLQKIYFILESDFEVYPGQLEELGRGLEKLRSHGKTLYCYAKSYELKELFIASFCHHRIMPEDGVIMHLGSSMKRNYYKGLLDRFGVKVDVYRRKEYKGAADSFRTSKMEKEQREAYGLVLKRILETLEETVVKNLALPDNFFQDLKEGKSLRMQEALDKNIITKIAYQEDLLRIWKIDKVKEEKIKVLEEAYGRGKKVGVLSFDGNIIDGESQKRGLMGPAIGDLSMVKEIEALREDKKIHGVVFKVNSGGGSATASAEIYQALLKLKEKKPLVVVQTGVAGSGGYYISIPGSKIYTQRSTITGSIGVITMLFYLKTFLEDKGINHDGIEDGAYADLMSVWRKRDKNDEALIMKEIDHIYEGFKDKVAKERNFSKDEVEAVAKGRIWPGIDGINQGICDEIGGLDDALLYLKEVLGEEKLQVSFYPKKKENILMRLIAGNAPGVEMESLQQLATVKEEVKTLNGKTMMGDENLLLSSFRI
ncbi:signal peptide peptidase SppA [Isachenkonia alkalipeptolytica]|uniref:Signal peptide peptidase SppA n=1 Tax=Isachenkonia alkalipeptolytica TaxID=2565777 RepID=A0AA43XN88_9CLOT|nr:signal peptide peptidase SppA [Isachenkonia alkalipeptolytica]NBG89677.1 signal peptide peptidase SppA [Isachenkonia alkalipeptolytica]